jgi:hypothetical protein
MPKCKNKNCGKLFKAKFSSFDKCCSDGCLTEYRVQYAMKAAEKYRKDREKERNDKDKAVIDALKEKHKDGPYYKKILQAVFNTYIRLRDEKLPCISCGNTNRIKYNAGHYFSLGAFPNLRYNEDNNNKQCEHCNSYLSGNLRNYREGLIKKIGQERFDLLESQKGVAKHYTVDELKEMIVIYKNKIKQLSEK